MTAPSGMAVRMKRHEHVYRTYLPRRTYTLLRLDGRAFHSYTRGLERPFDAQFAADMDATAVALCTEITGTAFAYVQSDEISLVVTDFASVNTEPWMGGNSAKVLSISAALATATFNRLRPGEPDSPAAPALFDSRVWTLADPSEVVNYFIWRQRDAVKNSVSMAASAHFSHKRLDGLNSNERQELLFKEAGVNWNDYPVGFKRGRVVSRHAVPGLATFMRDGQEQKMEVTRNVWTPAPSEHFTHDSDGWLRQHLPVLVNAG
jgi:tRNA(His) guanylyltransferase